jgi:hypothetical protein
VHTTDLSEFSPAERWALVRDGHAIVTDGIICAIDELPGPGLRLDAHLGNHFPGSKHIDSDRYAADQADAVAIEQSALWVLGATSTPPRQVCMAGLEGTRLYVGNANAQVRELIIQRSDCLSFGNRLVTTPARTAADIARHSPDDMTALQDLTDLAQQTGVAREQALAVLARTVHLPFARRARQRLAAALAHTVDVVNTVNSPNGVEESVEVTGVTHLKNKSIKS